MQDWQLNNVAEIFVEVSAERLWTALTELADTQQQYFMGSRVTVGGVGEPYCLKRDDGWEVNGTVLAKEPPSRLRVTWRVKTPPDTVMPNCEVEYLIEPALSHGTKSRTKLTVNSYVDGACASAVLKCKPHRVGNDHAKSKRLSRLKFGTAGNLRHRDL